MDINLLFDDKSLKDEIVSDILKFKNTLTNDSLINECNEILNFVIHRPKINKKALCITHMGIGDHILTIGAIRYISYFYNEVYIPCGLNNLETVKSFFKDNKDIFFDPCGNEGIRNLFTNFYNKGYDTFNSAFDNFFKNRYKNIFLQRKLEFSNNKFFANIFYKNINIPFEVFHKYFNIPKSDKSLELYNSVKNYNINFIHEKSSTYTLDFKSEIDLNSETDIYICLNRNLYKEGIKKELCENYLNNLNFSDYVDTIINSKKIITIDSSISCLVSILFCKNLIKTEDITIYCRSGNNDMNFISDKIKFKMI
jgi:hypothetical protein